MQTCSDWPLWVSLAACQLFALTPSLLWKLLCCSPTACSLSLAHWPSPAVLRPLQPEPLQERAETPSQVRSQGFLFNLFCGLSPEWKWPLIKAILDYFNSSSLHSLMVWDVAANLLYTVSLIFVFLFSLSRPTWPCGPWPTSRQHHQDGFSSNWGSANPTFVFVLRKKNNKTNKLNKQ